MSHIQENSKNAYEEKRLAERRARKEQKLNRKLERLEQQFEQAESGKSSRVYIRPLTQKIIYLVSASVSSLVGFLMLFIPFCILNQKTLLAPISFPISFLSSLGSGFSFDTLIGYTGLFLFAFWCLYFGFAVADIVKLAIKFKRGNLNYYKKVTKHLCLINTIATGTFFVGGLIFSLINTAFNMNAAPVNNAYLFIITLLIDIFVAVYLGITRDANAKKELSQKNLKKIQFNILSWEFFIYTSLLVACFLACSLSDILSVQFKQGVDALSGLSFTLNGYELLTNYSTFGDSGQILAFALMVLMSTILGLYIASFIALLSKSRAFFRLSLICIIVCCVGCFAIGLYSKYYQFLADINAKTILAWFKNSYPNVTEIQELTLTVFRKNYLGKYSVVSESFIFFWVALVPLVLVLARRPYSKGLALERELYPLNGDLSATVDNADLAIADLEDTNKTQSSASDGTAGDADTTTGASGANGATDTEQNAQAITGTSINPEPCPAFTEIDGMIGDDQKLLAEKQAAAFAEPTLPNIVQFVVQYAKNSTKHLSYTEEDIASFIAGLGAAKLTILQGMSGTGKTSLPKIFTEALYSTCDIVEVESSWRDKNELLGYYNEFSKTYTPKKFTQALYKARLNPETLTFIVLDEMNLSRIEYYFSDFLSLMENEPDKREIKLVNVGLFRNINNSQVPFKGLTRGHTIQIPPNVWFIGTANRDESTFEISDKVYDRANTMNFNKRAKKITHYSEPMSPRFISADTFNELLENAKASMAFSIDDYPVIAEVEKLLAPYNISFGNRIALQIENFVAIYCACFNATDDIIHDAVERILLTKVVYKLEFKSVQNKEELATAFDELGLHLCSEFISKLDEE